MIGSAASAVQFVQEIVKPARQLYLFPRTANWVLPKQDDPFTEERVERFRTDPKASQALRDEIYRRVDGGMTFSDPAALAAMEAAGLAAIEGARDPELRRKLRPQHPFGCKQSLLSNDYYAAFNQPNLELVTDAVERITKDAVVTVDDRARPVDTLILATGFSNLFMLYGPNTHNGSILSMIEL